MCIKIRISMLTYTHVHPNTQINTQIPSRTVTTRARSDSLSQNLLLKRLHTYRDKLPRLRGGGNEPRLARKSLALVRTVDLAALVHGVRRRLGPTGSLLMKMDVEVSPSG